jgi:hypothetical protein
MKRGDGASEGSLQSHSGVNLHPKMAKNRGSVPKGGGADGVALTPCCSYAGDEYSLSTHPDAMTCQ